MHKNEQADGNGWNLRIRKYVKNRKNRYERRKAKRDAESSPSYGKYHGWVT